MPEIEEKKDIAVIERFEEIENKVIEAIRAGDAELVLLLNDLTLARNIQDKLSKPQQKQFKVVYVAFKSDHGVVKRAGVYNSLVIEDPEEAEDVLISEDFENEDVLAVPRNSVFADLLK